MKDSLTTVALTVALLGSMGFMWYVLLIEAPKSDAPRPPAAQAAAPAHPVPVRSRPAAATPAATAGTTATSTATVNRDAGRLLWRARELACRGDVSGIEALRESLLHPAIQPPDGAGATPGQIKQMNRYLAQAQDLRVRLDAASMCNADDETAAPRRSADVRQPTSAVAAQATMGKKPATTATVTVAKASDEAAESPRAPEGTPSTAEPIPAAVPVSADAVGPQAELASVQRVLERYEDAYDRLDAKAATSILSEADSRTLAKTFARLERQDLNFEGCAIALSDSNASAQCTGWLSYVPRVDSSTTHRERHSWAIDLERVSGGWQIVRVRTR